MPSGSSRRVRLLALCGMAAPLLFWLTVGILGHLTPGYDPVTQVMSELGETGAPLAPVMNLAALAGTGILMILFSLGLWEGLGKGRAATAGSILVAGAGVAYLAMALFSCDPGCTPVTAAGEIHLAAGLLAMVMAIISVFTFALALRGRAGWEGCSLYSLVTGVLLVVILPVSVLAKDSAGLWQRVLAGVVFLWQEVMAIRLYLLAGPRA